MSPKTELDQDLVVQAGAPDTLLDDFTVHSALAAAALLGGDPGIFFGV